MIENIERHVGLGAHLERAIIEGAGEVGTPTFLATLCICIVFVPVFLLQGTAKYLFSPLSVSVIVSLLASLVLSFTLVPVLFKYLMRSALHAAPVPAGAGARLSPLQQMHVAFERRFQRFREQYRNVLAWSVAHARPTVLAFLLLMGPRSRSSRSSGGISFPR